jgi:predicted N-acetyltransferase YhbS
VTGFRLRPARPDEAELLGELALRSKEYWGYDRAFLDACRAELTLGPEEVQDRRMVVAETGGQVIGFYSLDGDPPEGELGHLWVEPGWIGRRIGQELWRHALEQATAAGFSALTIEAEPRAEGFYRAMGAVRVGEMPSGSVPGRMLPLLRVRLADDGADPTAGTGPWPRRPGR